MNKNPITFTWYYKEILNTAQKLPGNAPRIFKLLYVEMK